ncbi:MAG: serine hydrolase [Planctomycetota bacterium]
MDGSSACVFSGILSRTPPAASSRRPVEFQYTTRTLEKRPNGGLTARFPTAAAAIAALWVLAPRAASGGEAARRAALPGVYPGKTWTRAKPAEVGLDGAKLDELARFAGGRGCVVRRGYLAYVWGDASKRADVASASKPLFTHFLLLAIERGLVAGVDEKVVRFEPRLAEIGGPGGKDAAISWRHLANQTSSYGVSEKPGEAFDYSDYNMALFFDALVLRVYKTSWERADAGVLRPLLAGPIGCEDEPTLLAFGPGDRPGRLAISPRDFARFGLLYLRGGEWEGKRLVREDHIRLVTSTPLPNSIPRTAGKDAPMIPGQRSIGGGKNQTDHMGSYSFAWWTNGVDREGKRHWPDAPEDTYGAFGHGGIRAMVVIPSLDLVASWNDAKIDSREREDRALGLLARAAGRGD